MTRSNDDRWTAGEGAVEATPETGGSFGVFSPKALEDSVSGTVGRSIRP